MDSNAQTSRSQLEVILPDGKIQFYDLDPAKGTTTIGQGPENDIVLGGPATAPQQARLEHATRPFRIVLLSLEGEAALQGQPLDVNTPVEMLNGDALQLAGYTIILLESEEAPEPGQPKAIFLPRAVPPDQRDELIVASIPKREWTLNVQETAVIEVTVSNGGTLVAEFRIAVEGIDPAWVQIYPAEVNLNEGATATATIAITPPRAPTSRAGWHSLSVVVTSPTYPGHVARLGGSLIINPYYAFALGDLTPRRQVLRRSQEAGEATVEVRNEGNSEASFLFEAADDERALRYEFQVADEPTRLVNQAQVVIGPQGEPGGGDGTAAVRAITRPKRRPVVALRNRTHDYNVTVTPDAGKEASRTLAGQLLVRPLIGPWLFLLLLVSTVALIILAFWPQAAGLEVEPAVVPLGAPINLKWRVSQVSQASLRQGTAEPPFARVDRADGAMRITPDTAGKVTYLVEASNLLSRLSPGWLANWLAKLGDRFRTTRASTIEVLTPTPTPLPPPVITSFEVEPPEIVMGQSVDLLWAASGATSVMIDSPLGTVEPGQGKAKTRPDATGVITYVLMASNGTVAVQQTALLGVTPPPTPTPTPQAPRITYFALSQESLIYGADAEVILSWEVEGETTEITIKGTDIPDVSVAAKGEMAFRPGAAKDYLFVLTAKNGNLADSRSLQLGVLEPTATPTPTPSPTPTGTPLPAPRLVTFRVDAEGATCKRDTADCPGGTDCNVHEASDVSLIWEVANIYPGDQVSLKRGGEFAVPPAEEGNGFLPVPNAWIPSSFVLRVDSPRLSGGSASWKLCVRREAPPPPFDVNGGVDPDDPSKLKVTWRYSASYQAYIVGFRVYRIDYSGSAEFEMVHETSAVDERAWTDPAPGTCGKGYYVVALYNTAAGDTAETEPSNSWYSSPCP